MNDASSILRRLFHQATEFDFFQAVSLLEAATGAASQSTREARAALTPRSKPDDWIGHWESSLRDVCQDTPARLNRKPALEPSFPVRFRSQMTWNFPGADVAGVSTPRPGQPSAEMVVTFLSLAGASGPLPEPIADSVMERTLRGDHATRDFLDIFHHRLVALLYESRRASSMTVGHRTPWTSDLANALFAIAGLGFRPSHVRELLPQNSAIVPYAAGLLSHRARSGDGLEKLLGLYLKTPVRVWSYAGRWRPIEARDTSRIGSRHGRLNVLGKTSSLGRRYWDLQGSYRIEIGPLNHEQQDALSPYQRQCVSAAPQATPSSCHSEQVREHHSSPTDQEPLEHQPVRALSTHQDNTRPCPAQPNSFTAIAQLAAFYTGVELDFEILFRLRPSALAPLRLAAGTHCPPRLGWTTFLGANSGQPTEPLLPEFQRRVFEMGFWRGYGRPYLPSAACSLRLERFLAQLLQIWDRPRDTAKLGYEFGLFTARSTAAKLQPFATVAEAVDHRGTAFATRLRLRLPSVTVSFREVTRHLRRRKQDAGRDEN
jgi:type VI secretion system ImpH/TssG family protein